MRVFKIEDGASINNEQVQTAKRLAAEDAPIYYSRRESKDAIRSLRASTGMSDHLAYSLLGSVLPDRVVLHSSYKKDEKNLLESVTSLILSGDDIDADELEVLTDLRKLNYCDGDGCTSKFVTFLNAAIEVIELAGSGAHKRRHAIDSDLERTTNIVYTSQINSISQLVSQTKQYLCSEKKLVEGKDFEVPCDELIRRQFSPSHENRKSAGIFNALFNAKRTVIARNHRANNEHAHYCAQQKKLWRYVYSTIRNLLEDAWMEPECTLNLPWYFGIEVHSGDDKCGIPVARPGLPVVATAHSTTRAILPAGTIVTAADHDYGAPFKITPSATGILNIGLDPSESLLSGGEDGRGQIFVSFHDAIFDKSNCLNHMASSLFILRSE